MHLSKKFWFFFCLAFFLCNLNVSFALLLLKKSNTTSNSYIYANPFQVQNTYIHVLGKPVPAKSQAIHLGWERAFAQLWFNLTGNNIPPPFQDRYVLSYSIEDELIGKSEYNANISVVFDKHFVRTLIKNHHLKASEISLPPLIVIPVNANNQESVIQSDFYKMLQDSAFRFYPNLIPYRLINSDMKTFIPSKDLSFNDNKPINQALNLGILSGCFFLYYNPLQEVAIRGQWLSPYLSNEWIGEQPIINGNAENAVLELSYSLQNYFLQKTATSYDDPMYQGNIYLTYTNYQSWMTCFHKLKKSPIFDKVIIRNWSTQNASITVILHANSFGYQTYMKSLFPFHWENDSTLKC